MLMTSNWRDWYHLRHQQDCLVSGAQFEDYVTRILGRFHDDFTNPSPAGTLGDGGCDGLAEAGTILYACYGQRPARNAERELQKKLDSDFARGPKGDTSEELKAISERMRALQEHEGATNPRIAASMASLADGIAGLVKNMRSEQQLMRDWVEAQANEQKQMRITLDKLAEALRQQQEKN